MDDPMEQKIYTLPAIALRGLSILPGMMTHFDISREKSIVAIEKVMVDDQRVFLIAQKQPDVAEPKQEDLFKAGCIATVRQLVKMPDNIIRVMVEGLERAELMGLDTDGSCLMAQVETMLPASRQEVLDPVAVEAMIRIVKDKLEEYGRFNLRILKDVLPNLRQLEDLEALLDQVAIQLPLDHSLRQKVLESHLLSERYEHVVHSLVTEIEVTRVKREFQAQVKAAVDKNQKDYVLREQMKIIRKELGEDDPLSDADAYRQQIQALEADQEVKDKLLKEVERLTAMPGSSQESNVIRTYIETLLELPWNKASKDDNDIHHAEEILDADHYGLDKVKERILEYLAVRILTDKGTSPILCLVGPPGTGKTSVARSMARALDKKYVRISLGGVRDEAEIRGHRRTYVGAMPGRIAAGMRQAGVKNPLMLLDEIDKVSSDYKGDTSSALLEVLDSEQNNRFQDHYVELPMDLSEVLFIATANDAHTIPRPLLDRMELIEVSSYTQNEKVHIAKEHLIGKQMEKNGLKEGRLSISAGALESLISGYTREAGVRQLERKLGEVCRKAAREILEQNKKTVRLTENNLSRYLGKPRYVFDMANETDEIGIVRGLAWTSVGGDTLQIEVNIMPGKGEVSLTGMMGDVMKESAQTGLSYIRSVSGDYGIDKEFFQEHDIHIHIPEGAVPKDGPSAGITMATAMLSAITKIPVYASVAMTGEITLRGRVLPIGGLKEKILAAKSAGIKTVLVPAKNKRDVEEISGEIRKGIQIVYVEQMKEVLEAAFHDH